MNANDIFDIFSFFDIVSNRRSRTNISLLTFVNLVFYSITEILYFFKTRNIICLYEQNNA